MVIFIDEIEVLLGSRGSGNQSDFKDTKIAEFLTAWDGFHKTGSSTIVIGATNRKEILDDAILRRLPIKLGFDRNESFFINHYVFVSLTRVSVVLRHIGL